MATPAQRDAYRRVVRLILEEIEGCELDPKSTEAVELMDVVRELERRIVEGPQARPADVPAPKAHKAGKATAKARRPAQKPGKWQTGPLATAAINPAPKPPWFAD